ncbi:esterase/lipase family protein [Corynebacterium sp.]|uniref:esterase/lipase family protein n=1 Tax=Corynebacterium sp. TaxID=1720 RepID=UPI002A90F55F|nr:alpha/beta fold hydrolase [Corynebacterium sp.]MDY5784751.1 alpha/beta fold hydrolase [Corynebacterium sp.]
MALFPHLPRLLPDPSTATSQPSSRTVVAVHGTLGEPWTFRHLARQLEQRGIALIAPAVSGRAAGPLHDSTVQVAEVIRAACQQSQRVDVVGHSAGALVALRALSALNELHDASPDPLARVGTLVGVGASWRGTAHRAWYRPDGVVRRIFGEAFVELEDVAATPPEVPGVNIVSVYSTADRVVPAWSATLGETIALRGLSHRALLRRTDSILAALGL